MWETLGITQRHPRCRDSYGGVCVHMLIRVGRPVISVSVETLPLLRQWDFDDGVGKRMSVGRIGCHGRPGGPDQA